MPYNPGIQSLPLGGQTDQRAQIWGNAISNLGQSVSQGIRDYRQNQYLINQNLAKFDAVKNDPGFQQLLNSFGQDSVGAKAVAGANTGKLDLQKAAYLGGVAESYLNQKQQQNQMALTRAQVLNLSSEANMRNMQARGYGMMMNDVSQNGSSLNPGASPAPQQGSTPTNSNVPLALQINSGQQPQAAPPSQGNIPAASSGDPMASLGYTLDPNADANRVNRFAFAHSGKPMDPDAITAYLKNRTDALTQDLPTGAIAPPVPTFDPNGYHTGYQITPLVTKPILGGKMVPAFKDSYHIDAGQNPNLPVVDPTTGKQISFNSQQKLFNSNMPKSREEIAAAADNVSKARDSLSKFNYFKDAVDAYAAPDADLKGWKSVFATDSKLNAVFGKDLPSDVKSALTGKDPKAGIDAALGLVYDDMINELRNDKTGANALRQITQQELAQLQSQFGKADMPIYMQRGLIQNVVLMKQRDEQRVSMYYNLRKQGMSPEDAKDKILASPLGQPLQLKAVLSPTAAPQPGMVKMVAPQNVPSAANARLLQHFNDPGYISDYDSLYGPGAAENYIRSSQATTGTK